MLNKVALIFTNCPYDYVSCLGIIYGVFEIITPLARDIFAEELKRYIEKLAVFLLFLKASGVAS